MATPITRRWIEIPFPDSPNVHQLADDLNIDKKLAGLLFNRGITTFEEARKFFRPQLEHLHPPLLMKDMHRAVDRLQKAIAANERILVYGDYDVDGTTAVALVYGFLREFYHDVDFYIPDRYSEGYGISKTGIDYASDNGISLIIALDCGIKSNEIIEYAHTRGIDFIVCDHHLPGEQLPRAIVLDPKRNDCPYPCKELTGCGIGFKLLQAYSQACGIADTVIMQKLDLVAVSTASDIVPITGENRVLTYFGIRQINENPSRAISTILQVYGKKAPVTVSNLVFVVGPRINAAGRMTTGRHAVELLIARDDASMIEFVNLLNDMNQERKKIDQQMTTQALEIIASSEKLKNAKTTVLYNPVWHKGVLGIVASRLTENYYRPTILFTGEGEKATGSARSVEGFDVYAAIENCADLLIQFGGHKYAAGLTIRPENIEAFSKRFEETVSELILPEQLQPSVCIDLRLEDLSVLKPDKDHALPKFYRLIKQMEPFGPHNLPPVFMTPHLRAVYEPRLLTGNHIKMTVAHTRNPVLKFDAIAFGMGHYFERILNGDEFEMAYHLEENSWNGRTSLQMVVQDIRFNNP